MEKDNIYAGGVFYTKKVYMSFNHHFKAEWQSIGIQ